MENKLLYSTHSFISDHITIDNCYYLLSLSKRWLKQKQNIDELIISMTKLN